MSIYLTIPRYFTWFTHFHPVHRFMKQNLCSPFLKRFSSDLWSTKQIAQKMCSIFYLSTLSPEVYAHYPQSYPHPSLSILRQNLVIHRLIHIIHMGYSQKSRFSLEKRLLPVQIRCYNTFAHERAAYEFRKTGRGLWRHLR